VIPTALDGVRSTKELLAAVVQCLLYALSSSGEKG
jgi:hypothetical protein